MVTLFINSFLSEWLKRKRTASNWLIYIGAFFVPFVVLIGRFVASDFLVKSKSNLSPTMWEDLFQGSGTGMAFFLLPMGVILISSLIAQIEFKNNTWKQVITTPQPLAIIFFAKLAIIMVLMLQFFVLYNIGIYIAGALPSLFTDLPYPTETFPFWFMLKYSFRFFVDCLPIIAIQFLISMQFKNFMGPVGIGLGILVMSYLGNIWKWGFIIPYTYPMYNSSGTDYVLDTINIHWFAAAYSLAFILLGYFLFVNKKEKG